MRTIVRGFLVLVVQLFGEVIEDSKRDLADLGSRIRNARRSSGISQDKLAARAGIDRSFVSRLERGQANPTYLTLKKISTALEIDVSQLLSGSVKK